MDEPQTHEPVPGESPPTPTQEPSTAAAAPEPDRQAATEPPAATGPQELLAGPAPTAELTTADDYPQEQTWRERLPSGAVFLLRRPNVVSMLAKGDIPNPLMQAVKEIIDQEDKLDLTQRAEEHGRTEDEQREHELEEELREAAQHPPEPKGEEGLQFIDLVVYSSVVSPALSAEPPAEPGGAKAADGKLSLHAISDLDKMHINAWATEHLGLVATFRQEREGTDSERDSGTVRDNAEQPARDPA